jgi:hypothetical protein
LLDIARLRLGELAMLGDPRRRRRVTRFDVALRRIEPRRRADDRIAEVAVIEDHQRLRPEARVLDRVADDERVSAEAGDDLPPQRQAFAAHRRLSDGPGDADLIVVADPLLGDGDVLGRNVADPAVQAELGAVDLGGDADVAEPGRRQQTGEEVAQEAGRALLGKERRRDHAGFGDVAQRDAAVGSPGDVERAAGKNGELEPGSRLDFNRLDAAGRARGQHARPRVGDLRHTPDSPHQPIPLDRPPIKFRHPRSSPPRRAPLALSRGGVGRPGAVSHGRSAT